MYLLIPACVCCRVVFLVDLHPTMYLLILLYPHVSLFIVINLHPTMYLLIRRLRISTVISSNVFTSHYVSINSTGEINNPIYQPVFTSHYVSINSFYLLQYRCKHLYLHPTMYLLIPQLIYFITKTSSIYIPLCIY